MRGAAAALALAVAGCAAPETTVIPGPELPEDVYGSPAAPEAGELPDRATIYLILRGKLTPAPRRLPEVATSLPAASLEALLQGPAGVYRTAIPTGTRVIDVREEGGVATVNLTEEFERSAPGARLALRVAQVVYTITEAPGVFAVVFEIEGTRAAVLTGSEQVVERPVTRADYQPFAPEEDGADEEA